MKGYKPLTYKRFFKRFALFTLAIAIIIVGLHLWFVYNAKTILKNYIYEQSGGKIKLELSSLELNLLSKRLQINKADIISIDSLSEPITYHVTFNKLSLRVGSLAALLFQKRLLVDSLKLYDPNIQVMQWRKDTARVGVKDELSIPEEMGKFYNSLLDALEEFGVRRVVIANARVSLINKMKPNSVPVTVTRIFFDLARLPDQFENGKSFVRKQQALQLLTSNQNITLPGGRHRLSFKSFNLQLFRERIELDSCTITAVATDSIKSNYSVFFKKLSLVGVDFNAMSTQNIIKADSVYCEQPYFDFNLYRSDAVKKKTQLPDPDKIIQELTGNLNLAFVGVKNAGLHFDIHGKSNRSFYNTNKDNFEIHGFRINPDSSQPVSIGRFDMTLRDYKIYNEDSTSAISFDSLHFLNSKIALNNFTYISKPGSRNLRNDIAIRVPYFQLTNLDWYELIFDQNLVAQDAVLSEPDINFIRKRIGRTGKKINIFDALQNVDSLVSLGNVLVKNGNINMQLGPSTSFNVQNVDFKIYSDRLLHSTNKEGLRSALEHLSFSKGVLRLKDITANLQDARFTNNNLLYAEKVSVSGQGNKIAATVNKVDIDNMQLDDDAETIEVDGFRWQSAIVKLNALPSSKSNSNGGNSNSTILLKNVFGNNTMFNFSSGTTALSSYINTLNASSLLRKKNDEIVVDGFFIAGDDFNLKAKALQVNANSYQVSSTDASTITNVQVKQIKGRDSLQMQSSFVKFNANLNNLIANDIHLYNVEALAPVITIHNWDTTTTKSNLDSSVNELPVRIDAFTAIEPNINISTFRNDSASTINIPYSENSVVNATNIILSNDSMQVGSLSVNTTAATYKKTNGEILGIEKGKIDIDLSNIKLSKQEGNLNWSGAINKLSLQNAKGLGIGKMKSKLNFSEASIGNVNLSSQLLPNFGELMKANVSAWLHIPQGQFVDSITTLKWYNARFTNSSKTLSVDSFVYHPTQPLDSVLAHAPYQLDYITVNTGAINIEGLDVTQYEKDTSLIANSVSIQAPVLTVFRDKKPPISPNKKDKDLPVDIIKKITSPLSIDSILFSDGTITYSEKNGTSRKQGDLLLTHVNGGLANIKNTNLQDEDSLSLVFNAHFMDSIPLSVHLKESYTDSLAGLSIHTKTKGGSLSVLNPVLIPTSNVKITSGILDSLSFTAIARNDVALGEMDMHYKKLRIKLVKNGDPDQSTFLQTIASFLANTFLIKSNNTKRTGLIYYKRSPSHSFINYIVKMTLSGITSSVGVKKNKKIFKQYKKELEKNHQPPININLDY